MHIPERDGLFNAMVLLEVMVTRKKSLRQLCNELKQNFGTHRLCAVMKSNAAQKRTILAMLENLLQRRTVHLASWVIEAILKLQPKTDFKFFLRNAWLLIRASGTEPLVRFYAEGRDSMGRVSELIEEGLN